MLKFVIILAYFGRYVKLSGPSIFDSARRIVCRQHGIEPAVEQKKDPSCCDCKHEGSGDYG
ncbi:MAG: hypothetical protein AMJ54_10420 [Deltaproteobacteria bacterium SG8_13]|nr:MAG: hypothetical protein AMJ54_10420 [Deltaproteobacteria bacterium SG8_13]